MSGYRTLSSYLKKIVTGLRAVTVQQYTEANSKNGLQYYIRLAWPKPSGLFPGFVAVPAGGSVYISVTTTSKKLIAKSRIVSFLGEQFALELFSGPTITSPGTARTVGNYSRVNPVPTTVNVFKDVVVSDPGTPLDDEPEFYFGGSASGQRQADSIPQGVERILPAGTTFLIKITNTEAQVAYMQYYLDWYEGDPDLPPYDL